MFCAVSVLVLYMVSVRTERGQELDNRALEGREVVDERTLEVADDVLATISVTSLALGAGALVFVGLVRGRVLLALSVGVAIFGANVTTEVLKRIVFERPDLLDGVSQFGNTYPSGHATVAMSLAVGAILAAPRRLRGTAALAGVVYAGAVSTAVLIAGWHRPSDAIGAAFVAVGWGALVAAWLVAMRGDGWELPSQRPLEHRPAMWILTVAGALALVLVLLVTAGAAFEIGRDDLLVVERGRATAVALVAILGSDLLMLGLLLAALRRVTLDPPRRSPPSMVRLEALGRV